VQGRLRDTFLCCEIHTECGHCGRSIRIHLDSELKQKILEGPKDPLVFVPFVDFDKLKEPSIIDAF
jgi:hypothetical protein